MSSTIAELLKEAEKKKAANAAPNSLPSTSEISERPQIEKIYTAHIILKTSGNSKMMKLL